ncbi:N-acetyltransferase camello [Naegleria gruberi]|uniref:N-acetyltransferase camello n=1 Tax=Naegleria gruberi TaxID=5762 RepID=D2VM69_NAEGR|nr:N-acetyltransferase camello [Naegleria gruberi]EFC41934.1 N-acetyltransferase camello [Naegleria gruberi]|eukprot:XP_002674678.1 N-acetyltransferase camello [Naegleria gruberi strain NEG-M]
MNEYISKSRNSNELGDLFNYYSKNSEKPENNFFLAVDGEEIVGHVALDKWIYPGDAFEDAEFIQECDRVQNTSLKMLEIRRMSVKSSYRGGGVATALLKHVFKYSKELEMDRIILKTSSLQVGARRLYSKLGFEILGVLRFGPPFSVFKFMIDTSKINISK